MVGQCSVGITCANLNIVNCLKSLVYWVIFYGYSQFTKNFVDRFARVTHSDLRKLLRKCIHPFVSQ